MSVLTIDTRLGRPINQVRHVGPTAHVEAVGDPSQRHRRLLPQASGQFDLTLVPFAPRAELLFCPAPPSEFLTLASALAAGQANAAEAYGRMMRNETRFRIALVTGGPL